MRKIVIALLLVLVCVPVYLMTGHTAAHAVGCYANGCDGQDPIAMGCADDAITYSWAFIVNDNDPPRREGLLEMRYSAACEAVWTRITSYVGTVWINASTIRIPVPAYSWGSEATQAYTGMAGNTGTIESYGCVTNFCQELWW